MATLFELYLLPNDINLSGNPIVRIQLDTYSVPVFTYITLQRFQELYPDKDAIVASKNTMKTGNHITMLSIVFDGDEFQMLSDLGIINDVLIVNSHGVNAEDISHKLFPVIHALQSSKKRDAYMAKYTGFEEFLKKLETICANCEFHKTARVKISWRKYA